MTKELEQARSRRVVVLEEEGDLFDAPDNAVLIHACNCLGSWGAGIAKAFKTKYPTAHQVHNDYCKATPTEELIGTCQLIPLQRKTETQAQGSSVRPTKRRRVDNDSEPEVKGSTGAREHWIACLFTSVGYGKATKKHPGMDKPDVILANTEKALKDLREQIVQLRGNYRDKGKVSGDNASSALFASGPGELWSCRFNSGLFAVDWADTRRVLEEELGALEESVRVVRPAQS